MTREEILALPAGRAMDTLIARWIMGWTVRTGEEHWEGCPIPLWSTNAQDNAELVKYLLKECRREVHIRYGTKARPQGGGWECYIGRFMEYGWDYGLEWEAAEGRDMLEAICRCALLVAKFHGWVFEDK